MLLAIDVDGTISTNGNYFCRWMIKHAGISVPEEALATLVYSRAFWQLPQVQSLSHARREELRSIAKAHHKDLDLLEHSIPIPGACQALQQLAREGARIMYTTCRPAAAEQITRTWLTRYGFPASDRVSICEQYHDKYIHAHAVAKKQEPVVLIDDLIEKMVPAFVFLAKHHRETAVSLIKRLAVVEIGREEPRSFPYTVPFPVLALPSWRAEHFVQLRKNG